MNAAQWVIWAVFALEYLVFLVLSPNRKRYVRRHLFALLTVVLPFLRVFRALRAVRAVRALRAVRVASVTRRGALELRGLLQWSAFAYFTVVVAIVTLLAAAAMVGLEAGANDTPLATYGAALWWAIGIVTTIGSSAEPVTTEGRALATVLYVIGMAVPAYLGGVIASSLIGQQRADDAARDEAARDDAADDEDAASVMRRVESKLDALLERVRQLEERDGSGA